MVSKFRIISILLTTIIITFTAGFYTAIYLEQINFITSTSTILLIATIIGVSFNVSKILVDWVIDKMNIPVLQYTGIIKRGMKYYLRIKKVKGKHQAKSVKGFITVENTDINNTPIIWDFENSHLLILALLRISIYLQRSCNFFSINK
jgi:hypothetical protein